LPRVTKSLRPLAFRRAAAATLRALQPETTLSFGVNCPPGDVYWVQSVHRAWLEDGGDVVFHGLRVPSGVRKLLLRHQVLLRLEHDYFANHRPRAILCTSQREVDDLARLYRVPREILHVVPNGFDGSLFSTERREQDRAEMRQSIGADEDDVVLLIIANEWHRKGLGTLIEAVGALNDRRIRLDLVGVRSPDDYRPLAQRLGLAERMHWHGSSSNVSRFHAAADIFALPTTYEPFGLVIIEAMASGLPVVTSRLAGAATAIEHGVNGLLIDDPRDSARLSAELGRLLDPDERERMGNAAASTVGAYEWREVFTHAESLMFRT
jgi:UDP-glucose:(heptosyl)LPS alpha-1,3-glucosyltransferase